MRYVGGPLDGRNITTRYDHLPVIRHPFPKGPMVEPETIESYERRGDSFHHLRSEPYPNMRDKLTLPGREAGNNFNNNEEKGNGGS